VVLGKSNCKKIPAGNAPSGLKHGDYPLSGLKPISAFEPE